MSKTKIFIDGEHGTTGLQIREKILNKIAGSIDLELLQIKDESKKKDVNVRAEMLNAADYAILCLPDDDARESVSLIKNETTRVIDTSTAHRTYTNWVYGFPEIGLRKKIETARFVANPGCHATGALAILKPLRANGIISPDQTIDITSITGYSGGGKRMITNYEHSSWCSEHDAPIPYAINLNHKHLPEIKMQAGLNKNPLFLSIVCNFKQGMLIMIKFDLKSLPVKTSARKIHDAFADYYSFPINKDERVAEMFIDVLPFNKYDTIDPRSCNETNRLDINISGNDNQVLIMSCLDNLGKGASGAAIQNLNIMMGLNEWDDLKQQRYR